jgi:hypothetical protein
MVSDSDRVIHFFIAGPIILSVVNIDMGRKIRRPENNAERSRRDACLPKLGVAVNNDMKR